VSLPVPTESALLVRIPTAEPAVSRHRNNYDPAARVGVPAHVTIAYPFKPVELLTRDDTEALSQIFAGFQTVEVTLITTAWFGHHVLHLEPADPGPLVALTAAVEKAFSNYPIYGGAHEDVRPHLTVGYARDRADLAAVERDVLTFLPVEQLVRGVELWHGPALATGGGRWSHVRTFPLGHAQAPEG